MRKFFIRTCWLASVLYGICTVSHSAQDTAKVNPGEKLFSFDFDGDNPLDGWNMNKWAKAVPGRNGGNAICVEIKKGDVPPGENGMITHKLDVKKLRGKRVFISGWMKIENVTKPKPKWLGTKMMLHYKAPSGNKWINPNNVYGTFDWQRKTFITDIAADATEASLCLGLQAVSGKCWIDDIKCTVIRGIPDRSKATPAPGPMFKGHSLPRLRGAMAPHDPTDKTLHDLGKDWGANVIRWQMRWTAADRGKADFEDMKAYDEWLAAELDLLDSLLSACKKYGLLIVLDLHTFPGGRTSDGGNRIFFKKEYQDKLVEVWQMMARRYKGNELIWGYDIANEPDEKSFDPEAGVLDWQDLSELVSKEIRKIDAKTPIIIETPEYNSPKSFAMFRALDVPRVIYSVHVYNPGTFTHQGVRGSKIGFVYPGKIQNEMWNKERLKQALQPVLDFQKAYNAHIYVGEFSAIRWAPDNSAYRYLKDAIEIFEEYGWDWTYHAFRESPVWNVEYTTDKNNNKPSKTRTDREQLLRDWFAKNKQPDFATIE